MAQSGHGMAMLPLSRELLRISYRTIKAAIQAGRRTVSLYLTVVAFDNLAQLRPFGEVLEVESDVVCLR